MEQVVLKDPVAAAHARTDGYWYKDGINEISMGIGMLGGAMVAYMVHTEIATGKAEWPGVTVGLVGVLLTFADGRLKKYLRERFSYPRIGYLSEKGGEPLSRRRKALIVIVMTALLLFPIAVLVYLLDRPHQPASSLFGWMRWGPLAAAPFFFAGSVFDYRRFKLRRILVDGVLTMIAGVASSLLFDAAFLPYVVFAGTCAIIKIAAGTQTLLSIVRTVPVSAE